MRNSSKCRNTHRTGVQAGVKERVCRGATLVKHTTTASRQCAPHITGNTGSLLRGPAHTPPVRHVGVRGDHVDMAHGQGQGVVKHDEPLVLVAQRYRKGKRALDRGDVV